MTERMKDLKKSGLYLDKELEIIDFISYEDASKKYSMIAELESYVRTLEENLILTREEELALLDIEGSLDSLRQFTQQISLGQREYR